jgi:hypothetical protein
MPMNPRILRPLARPLLLDAVPGAAAAYSLRQLSNAYTGPVVTVRRSSDNAEEDFKASEIDDGTLTAFCGAGDGLVKTWFDQSGSGNDASQGTAAAQPKIVDSGTLVTEGGKAALDFDGTDDWFAVSLSSLSPWSVFAVQARDAVGDYGISLARSDASPGPYAFTQFLSGGNFARSREGFISVTDSTAQQSLLVTISGAGGISELAAYKDGAIMPSTSTASATAIDFSSVARLGSNYHKGTLQELLLYNSDQTENRQRIESDINRHFGIF